MPDLPGGSSAAPTRYHSMWVTTGVRRSGITTTVMPFASENCVTAGAAAASRAPGAASGVHRAEDQEGANQHGRHGFLFRPAPSTGRTGHCPAMIRSTVVVVPDRAVEDRRDLPAAAACPGLPRRASSTTASGSRAAAGSASRASARLERRRLGAVVADEVAPGEDAPGARARSGAAAGRYRCLPASRTWTDRSTRCGARDWRRGAFRPASCANWCPDLRPWR